MSYLICDMKWPPRSFGLLLCFFVKSLVYARKPFSQDYHQWSCVCVLMLNIRGVTYHLKAIPNDWAFQRLSMAIWFIFRKFLPEICWEKVADEIFFHIFFLMCELGLNRDLTTNKSTPYLLSCGDCPIHM